MTITTPSRLHFGLLGWGESAPREFGGVGLMVRQPGLRVSAELAERPECSGPYRLRVDRIATAVRQYWSERGRTAPPLRITIEHAPAEHVGLGTGTQLSLAVTRLVSAFAGEFGPDAARLAQLAGRGGRSGIGLHGFTHGGLIVDGGRRQPGSGPPPLLARLDFPEDWSVLVVVPPVATGLHGTDEVEAFESLPPISAAVSDRLCRLVLLGLLPAVVERDIDAFGAALTAIQLHVGRAFAPAQRGRLYAHEDLEPLIDFLRLHGLAGVGQSSWGPTVYAFARFDPDERAGLLARLNDRFGFGPDQAFWTAASPTGAMVELEYD